MGITVGDEVNGDGAPDGFRLDLLLLFSSDLTVGDEVNGDGDGFRLDLLLLFSSDLFRSSALFRSFVLTERRSVGASVGARVGVQFGGVRVGLWIGLYVGFGVGGGIHMVLAAYLLFVA